MKNIVYDKRISGFVLLILLLASIGMASASKTVDSDKIQVLHVSCIQENEVQKIIDTAGASSYFNITQVSISDFNKGIPSDLSQYDVVVFGVNDGYEYSYEVISRNTELKNYVENGGGILFTHDSLEAHNNYPELDEVAGIDNKETIVTNIMYSAEIVQEHEILHTPFELGNVGNIIDTQKTHTSGGEVTTATIIMQGGGLSPALNNFYLTVNEYGNGRAVVDELGHSVAGLTGGSLTLPSVKESQIFANALYWAGQSNGNKPVVNISPESTSPLYPNETFSINITLDPNGIGVSGGEFDISFDPSILEVTDLIKGDILGTDALDTGSKYNNTDGRVIAVLGRVGVTIPPTQSGTWATITFKVKPDASDGTTYINITSAGIGDENFNEITDITTNNGTATIVLLVGDINHDGKVNYLDLAILGASYGLSEGEAGYNQDADLNHDGIVNYLDLAMLGANYGKSI